MLLSRKELFPKCRSFFIFLVSVPTSSLPASLWRVLWYPGNSFSGLFQLEMTKQKLEVYFFYGNNCARAVQWEQRQWCVEGWHRVRPLRVFWIFTVHLPHRLRQRCVRETDEHVHIRGCKSSRDSSQLPIAAEIEYVMDRFIDLGLQHRHSLAFACLCSAQKPILRIFRQPKNSAASKGLKIEPAGGQHLWMRCATFSSSESAWNTKLWAAAWSLNRTSLVWVEIYVVL